jgi:hypothetical protein
MMTQPASAVFDTRSEAERAIADLRAGGVPESALSVIAPRGEAGGTDADDHGSVVRGILGGGALGAGLGIAALAIPGVGPLAAAGAIAASAVPGAAAIGAAVGATAGTLNETLASHGVSDDDAAYYGEHLGRGGVVVTVADNAAVPAETALDILYRHGGHSAHRSRATTAY